MLSIYDGTLSFNASETDLRMASEPHRSVTRATVVVDHETGRPRSFGFIEMEGREAGLKAAAAVNGQMIAGREVQVNEAQPCPLGQAQRVASGGSSC